MQPRWKPFRHRLEWLGVKLLAWMVPRLPRRACAVIAKGLGSLAFALDSRGRNVALANLEAAFPDRFTPAEKHRIARESYQNFARTMLDLFWAPSLAKPGVAEKYIHFSGDDVLRDSRGMPFVGICVHNAGFEWASLAGALRGGKGMILTEAFKNPLLDEIFTSLRTSTGHDIITQNFSMLRMLRRMKAGGRVGILIDLTLPPDQSATIIEAFGMKMCVTHLHAVLSQRVGAWLTPITSEPLPDGSCRVEIHRPIEVSREASLQEITQAVWDFFEPRIRERPELWMWAYKHWRFLPDGEDPDRYPAYSKRSSKFEKLRRSLAADVKVR